MVPEFFRITYLLDHQRTYSDPLYTLWRELPAVLDSLLGIKTLKLKHTQKRRLAKEPLYKTFKITEIDETKLLASVLGEKLNPDRHEIYTEVKAVTYHQLYIKETNSGWEAQVIFDL